MTVTVLGVAVEDDVELLLGQLAHRDVGAEAVLLGDAFEEAEVPGAGRGGARPGHDGAFGSVRFLFGMTSSGSISILTPRPVQSGQAPWGLLKLKLRGASSPKERPQRAQARCSE